MFFFHNLNIGTSFTIVLDNSFIQFAIVFEFVPTKWFNILPEYSTLHFNKEDVTLNMWYWNSTKMVLRLKWIDKDNFRPKNVEKKEWLMSEKEKHWKEDFLIKSSNILKSSSYLPKRIVLFALLKVLLKWWKMLFISP